MTVQMVFDTYFHSLVHPLVRTGVEFYIICLTRRVEHYSGTRLKLRKHLSAITIIHDGRKPIKKHDATHTHASLPDSKPLA